MPLQKELRAIDERISAINVQIQAIRWRRTPENDRRYLSFDNEGSALEDEASIADRRLPDKARVALLRAELSEALQHYMKLQALLRPNEEIASEEDSYRKQDCLN